MVSLTEIKNDKISMMSFTFWPKIYFTPMIPSKTIYTCRAPEEPASIKTEIEILEYNIGW